MRDLKSPAIVPKTVSFKKSEFVGSPKSGSLLPV